jgi:prophage regulatory protein
MNVCILREPAALQATGMPRSSFRDQLRAGFYTRPVKLGARAVGWPAHEIDAVLRARIAGQSDDQIKKLVQELETQRKSPSNSRGALGGASA